MARSVLAAALEILDRDGTDALSMRRLARALDRDPMILYRALFGFLHGHILDELQELTVSPEETDALLRLGLHRLPVGDFPLLRGLAPVLAGYDGAAELERGLDILLTGLTATLPARPPAGGTPHRSDGPEPAHHERNTR